MTPLNVKVIVVEIKILTLSKLVWDPKTNVPLLIVHKL